MVYVDTAANKDGFAAQLASMFEDRRRVFVDLFKWNLAVTDDGLEIDQFDDEHAVYLLLPESDGRHLGSLRLLRTDRPHILGSLFADLYEHGVPAGSDVREITRLCLSPRLPAAQRLRVRNALISAMVDHALAQGIRTLTGVVKARFLYQVAAMGWRYERLGPLRLVDGATIGAFRIDIDQATPELLAAAGIYTPQAIAATDMSGAMRRSPWARTIKPQQL